MRELGVVKKVDGRLVTISVQLQEGCASCAMNGACHSHNNALLAYNKEDINVAEGDDVEIEIRSSEQAKGAFWVLGLPLAALFVGYGLGKLLIHSQGEGAAVGSAGVLFVLSLAFGAFVQKRKKYDSFPFITKKFSAAAEIQQLSV